MPGKGHAMWAGTVRKSLTHCMCMFEKGRMCERRVSGFWQYLMLDAVRLLCYTSERGAFLNGLIKSQSPLKRNAATSNHSHSPPVWQAAYYVLTFFPLLFTYFFCIKKFRMSLMCYFKSQTAFKNKYYKCYFSWY